MFRKRSQKPEIEVLVRRGVDNIGSYGMVLARSLTGKQQLPDEDSARLIIYCFALNYVLLDRIAFSTLNADERNTYSDRVFEGISSDIANGMGIANGIVVELLNKYVTQLSPYAGKLVDQGDGVEGTLFWEFSKLINEEIDGLALGTLEAMTVWPVVCEKLGTDFMNEVSGYFMDNVQRTSAYE